ncbi:MAG TPA: hypothetical protein VLT32_06310 [Candidatus Sulfomarinibacteraceae bacterium]|nr:hypothetical protein [Candidatus Sulfomarinibacteraceae bacterium]
MTRSGPRRRSRRRLAAYIAVQLLVVLVLVEVVVRLAEPHHRGLRMLLRASTDTTDFSDAETLPELMGRTMLGFAPGTVQFGFVLNSRSFRTREYEPGPARDRFRVVALGDSFTFASGGLPHEDHWTTVLQAELGDRAARPVEVLRLGVPDTGPAFQLRLWQVEASRLAPDAVVLAFFVGNDFVDHQGDRGPFADDGRGLSARLASASAAYRALRNLARVAGAGGLAAVDRGEPGPAAPGEPVPGYREAFDGGLPTFPEGRFLAIEAERMALCLRSEEAAFEALARRTAAVVGELAAEVEASGASFVVMLIPDQYQVASELAGAAARTAGRSLADYDLDRPQRVLTAMLEASGIRVLDLLPVLRDEAAAAPVYRPRDTHWNARGNRIAADLLAERLAPSRPDDRTELFADGLEAGTAAAWSLVSAGENVRPITVEP